MAIARLAATKWRTREFTRRFDVVLTPALAEPPPLIGHLDPLAQTVDGLPIGMMFAAPTGAEATLLQLAYELEEAQPFRRIQG